MALGDLERRVVTRYSAITTEHEKALEKLKGKTEESRKGFVDWAKSLADGVNSGVDHLGRINLALGGVTKLVEFGREAWKTYATELRLTAAAGNTDLEKLRKATGGLKDDTELLAFAAKAQHGTLKLSQEQMDLTAGAMVALQRASFDGEEVTKKLTKAVVELNFEGLKELGVTVQKGATLQETLNNAMKEFKRVIAQNKSLANEEAEDVERLSTSWSNAKNSLMAYAGASMSWSAMKNGRGALFDATNVLTFGQAGRNLSSRKKEEAEKSTLDFGAMFNQSDLDRGAFDPKTPGANWFPTSDDFKGLFSVDPWAKLPEIPELKINTIKAKSIEAPPPNKWKNNAESFNDLDRSFAGQSTDAELRDDQLARNKAAFAKAQADNERFQKIAEMNKSLLTVEERYANFTADQPTLLEKMFGPLDQMDLYKTGFQGLTDSIVAGMDAWGLGAKDASSTFRKALGAGVHGLASKLNAFGAAEMIEAGAHALTLDFAGAARHAGAGALYFAGGFAANRVAASLGYSGSSSSSSSSAAAGGGGGAAASSPSSGGASGGGGETYHYYITSNPWSPDDTPRMKRNKQERFEENTRGGPGVSF